MMGIKDNLFSHSALYNKEFNKLLEPIKQFFGVNNAGIFYVDKQKNLINIHSHIEWMARCIDKEYFLCDPHIVDPLNIGNGFALDTPVGSPSNDFIDKLVYEAESMYNMFHGITYVNKNNKGGYFSISCDTVRENYSMPNKILANQQCFVEFVTYLEDKLKDIFATLSSDRPVNLYELKSQQLSTQMGIVPNIKTKEKANFLSKIKAIEENDKMLGKLTPIEMDCLKLFLNGKTAEESASILKTTRRSIEWHFESIKNKLNCMYKKDLIEKVKSLKLLGLL